MKCMKLLQRRLWRRCGQNREVSVQRFQHELVGARAGDGRVHDPTVLAVAGQQRVGRGV